MLLLMVKSDLDCFRSGCAQNGPPMPTLRTPTATCETLCFSAQLPHNNFESYFVYLAEWSNSLMCSQVRASSLWLHLAPSAWTQYDLDKCFWCKPHFLSSLFSHQPQFNWVGHWDHHFVISGAFVQLFSVSGTFVQVEEVIWPWDQRNSRGGNAFGSIFNEVLKHTTKQCLVTIFWCFRARWWASATTRRSPQVSTCGDRSFRADPTPPQSLFCW